MMLRQYLASKFDPSANGPPRSHAPLAPLHSAYSSTHSRPALLLPPAALDCSYLSSGVSFADFSSKNFTSELWQAISELSPGVVSLNFTGNALTSLSSFTRLQPSAPSLLNLSLANNALDKLDQLEALSAYRDQLNELILTGNPLHPSSSSLTPSSSALDPLLYSHSVASLFPNLKLLDTQPLTPLISFDLPPMISTSTLPPILGSFFDSPKSAELVKAFVDKFFACLDSSSTERQKLVSVYTDDATFSLALPVHDAQQQQQQTTLINPVYSQLNRNALHLAKLSKQQIPSTSSSLLKTGPVSIVYALSQLPPTQHHIDSFVADVLLVPSTSQLFLTLRGTMLETDSATLRAFHRTFVLQAPGADARSKGWGVSVANDQLFLGASKMQALQAPASGLSHSSSLQSLSPVPTSLSPSPDAQVQQLVQQLSAQTGVDQTTALQVLQQSQGNAEVAFNTIQAILQQQTGQLG